MHSLTPTGIGVGICLAALTVTETGGAAPIGPERLLDFGLAGAFGVTALWMLQRMERNHRDDDRQHREELKDLITQIRDERTEQWRTIDRLVTDNTRAFGRFARIAERMLGPSGGGGGIDDFDDKR